MGAAPVPQEVLQGLVHRPAVLGRARQAIEVGQHLRAVAVELVIQLSPAAQLAQEQLAEAEAEANRMKAGYRHEEIQQAEAATRRELAGLQELQRGPRPQEIAQAQADYEAAKADAVNGATSFARIDKLHESGDVSAQARDEARARRDQLAGRAEWARQRLEMLRAGTRSEEIRAAEQRYRAAQAAERIDAQGVSKGGYS